MKDETDQMLLTMAHNSIVLTTAIVEAGGAAKMVMGGDYSLNEFLITLARNNIKLDATHISS